MDKPFKPKWSHHPALQPQSHASLDNALLQQHALATNPAVLWSPCRTEMLCWMQRLHPRKE